MILIMMYLVIPFYGLCEPGNENRVAGEEFQRLLENIRNEVNTRAVHKPEEETVFRNMLKMYMKSVDSHCNYMDRDEYAVIKSVQNININNFDIGFERDSENQIICIPYQDGIAKMAGVEKGNVLVAVNEVNVSGKSVVEVNAMIREQKEPDIVLRIKIAEKGEEDIILKQNAANDNFLKIYDDGNTRIIKIVSFTDTVLKDLKNLSVKLKKSTPVVIDLRGTCDDNIQNAINAAMLFLKKGKKIVGVKSVEGIIYYENINSPVNVESPLYLWQDEESACAAEVFIASLTENKRAVSIGKKSFGLGIKQEVIELIDRSSIKLTTAYLLTPNGFLYNKQGLAPTYSLDLSKPDNNDYMETTIGLMNPQLLLNESNSISDKTEIVLDHYLADETEDTDVELAQNGIFVCFNNDFDNEEDAEFWALVIANSINDVPVQNLVKVNNGEYTNFIVCHGPFQNMEMAEQYHSRILETMKVETSIDIIILNKK